MIDEAEFCHWLAGYLEGGASGGIEPIRAKLNAILENRLVDVD